MNEYWKKISAKLRAVQNSILTFLSQRSTRANYKLRNLGNGQEMGYRDSVISFWENYSHLRVLGVGMIRCQHGHEHNCNLQLWQLKNGRLEVNIDSCSKLKCDSYYSFEGKLIKHTEVLNDWQINITQISRNLKVVPPDRSRYSYFGQANGIVSIHDIG